MFPGPHYREMAMTQRPNSRRRLTVAAALILGSMVMARPGHAKYVIQADGPMGVATYDLLGKAFTIETPDCGHPVPHITEAYDDELKKNVFVFHLHVKSHLDDDRCGAKDRQRTEIRGGKLSDVVAANGDTVYYRWKFKLPAGFQTSGSFTHIMQIKSDAGAPVMTLTPRGANISIDGIVGVRGTTALAKFIGVWVVADLKVKFATAGHIDMTIRRLGTGEVFFQHSGDADTWQGNGAGHDPKWGIYRSLNSAGSLRDEDDLRFADFCITKTSAADCDDASVPMTTGPAPPPAATPDGGGAPGGGNSDAGEGGGGPGPGGETPPPPDAGGGGSTPVPPTGGGEQPPTPTPTGGTGGSPPVRPKGHSGCAIAPAASGPGTALGAAVLACALGFLRRRRR
jgi:hypothetical protein